MHGIDAPKLVKGGTKSGKLAAKPLPDSEESILGAGFTVHESFRNEGLDMQRGEGEPHGETVFDLPQYCL